MTDQLDLAKAIIGKLPAEIKTSDRGLYSGQNAQRTGTLWHPCAASLARTKLIPRKTNSDLHRVATYTGDYRWLCKHHYDAWQPNIPDVIHRTINSMISASHSSPLDHTDRRIH